VHGPGPYDDGRWRGLDDADLSIGVDLVEFADRARRRVEQARERVGGMGAVLALGTEATGLDVVATVGFDPIDVDKWRHIDTLTPVPLAECLRTGAPVACESPETRTARYPLLVRADAPADATACCPVRRGGRVVGVLGVAFRGPRRLSEQEWALLAELADGCAADLPAAEGSDGAAAPPDPAVLDDPKRLAEFTRLGLAGGELTVSVDRWSSLAMRLLGGRQAQVSLLGDEQIVASTAGFSLPAGDRRSPLADSLCSVCVAGGRPLVVTDAPNHPWVRELPPVRDGGVRRYVGVPLTTAAGVAVGAICVYDSDARVWPPGAVEVLTDLAAAVVTELEMHSASSELKRTTGRLSRLQDLSARLATVTTVSAVVEVLVDRMTGLLGVQGVVGIRSADGTELRTWPTRPGLPSEVVRRFRTLPWDAPTQLSEAARTGSPVVLHSPDEIRARFPDTADSYAAVSAESALAVALLVDGTVLGALAVGFDGGHRIGDDDLSFAQSVADIAAQAVYRARLYERERDAARVLQDALLPGPVGDLPGVRVAVRYRPADNRVGGDWFDVFALARGRVGIVIGDVAGHDLPAAATMGRLQAMARAIATTTTGGPARVLELLDEASAGLPGSRIATVGYGEYDPATGRLRYACAGHLPPLVLDGGRASFLWEGRSLPLGVARGARPEAEVTLPSGTVLLWCTDGLVERRGTVIDDGLDRLAHAAGLLPAADPDEICDHVMREMAPPSLPIDDDVALIGIRLGRSR
jgi:serine phosphatase RsbU (regulator of sigma subunit)